MLRQVFASLGGMDGFGIVSMMMFILFFTLVIIRVVKLEKTKADEFSRIPFDESIKESENNVQC